MLYIIGLGLGDERDITLRGLEAVKRCNKVYMEACTSLLSFGFSSDSLSTLETLFGKVITIIDPETVEERADELLSEARVADVAFLVVGDPFGATTRTDLVVRAKKLGVFVKVVHNASGMTAVGVCGLQLYRYGETVSIPFFTETWRPDSFYEKIQRNRMLGLHTLCLLASLDFTAQTGNASSGDWQEEVYQKIKTMKDEYLPELNEMYQKIVGKLQQHDSLPQQPKNENLEKLKIFKNMLERIMAFLQVSKSNILPGFKDKLGSYEKQIINFINSSRPRKLSGQHPLAHMPSMQQSQRSQSQITLVQPLENQMNPQLQSRNLQGSLSTMQKNNVTNLQHNSLSSLSGVPNVSQSMINTLQPSSNIDSASLDFTGQTGNASSGDWQEEVYQKIKTMKDEYLPELNEMYQKIAGKLQQHDSLPQQPKNEKLEKLKIFRTMLERIIAFLQVSKSNILPGFKDNLGSYEKQIINFINSNRPRKVPGQHPLAHMPSMQQSQWSQSQITQVQPLENQMNPQLQSMNLQGSVSTMQQNNVTNLQHNSLSSSSGVSNVSQSMINTLQPSSNIDSGQGNALSTLQQVAVGPLQQIPVNTSQQVNMNSLSSQSEMNALQANLTPLESNSNMLQHQHLKQQEQLMLQTQQMKQLYQQLRQMQQQLIHIEQMMQQQQQQQQQQQRQQMPQLRQMNDVNELKMRVGVKAEGCVW